MGNFQDNLSSISAFSIYMKVPKSPMSHGVKSDLDLCD